jgi:hypothetical protein
MAIAFTQSLPFFTKNGPSFKVSACLQICILLLAALVLDGGDVLNFMLIAATAYWSAVAIIMIRRNGNATWIDQFLLKWGFPLTILLTALVATIVPVGFLRHP